MKRYISLLTLVTVLALFLAACSGGTANETADETGAEEAAEGPTEAEETDVEQEEVAITYLSTNQEDEGQPRVVGILAEQCQAEVPSAVYEFQFIPQADLVQRVQLLAGSNSLPTIFDYESGAPLVDLIESDLVLNLGETFQELGIYEELSPAAITLLESLVDGAGLYALPMELNIEGFWYNETIFAENNIEVPTTWDELMTAAETLQANGIQPFAVAGAESWPITRLINAYVVRYYGPDVMARVVDGELEVTDAGFIEAAQVVQDMAEAGYFGRGVTTIDYATGIDQFSQGQAAMLYMGSWTLRDFNDPETTPIGADNIGLFNIPLVEGGEGTLDQWSMNAGLTLSASRAEYEANPEVIGDWFTCVFSDYGDAAMNELGLVTGFEVEEMPDDVPPLTQEVIDFIASAEEGFLWFEARFNARAQDTAWSNAQLLVIGEMTPEDYMSALQSAIDEQISGQ